MHLMVQVKLITVSLVSAIRAMEPVTLGNVAMNAEKLIAVSLTVITHWNVCDKAIFSFKVFKDLMT